MKPLIVFLSAILLMPASAMADVRNIREMQQSGNGTFQVTCLDRQIETVSADQILQNNVCNSIRIELRSNRSRSGYPNNGYPNNGYPNRHSDDRASDNAGVVCSGDSFFDWYYITRISDGKKLSDKMPLAKCSQAVSSARRGIVCSGDSFFNWFYLTRISNEQKLGERVSLDQCLALINDVR